MAEWRWIAEVIIRFQYIFSKESKDESYSGASFAGRMEPDVGKQGPKQQK